LFGHFLRKKLSFQPIDLFFRDPPDLSDLESWYLFCPKPSINGLWANLEIMGKLNDSKKITFHFSTSHRSLLF